MKNFLFFIAGFAAACFAVMLYLIFGKSSRPRDRWDPPDRIEVTEIVFPNSTIKGAIRMFTLKEGQRVLLRFIARTRRGNTAAVQDLRVTSSDESVVSVTAHETEENAFWAEGLDGSANETVLIEARGDADLGEGVREIIGTTSGVCTQGDAFSFEIEVGTPEDVPTTEPEGGDVNGGAVATEPNEGVEENQSSGTGAGEGASGTTDPADSNNVPTGDADVMTAGEGAADTAERNSDRVPGES